MPESATLYGDELLVAVFKHFGQPSSFRISSEDQLIEAFYNAKQKANGEFDELFANYPFDIDGLAPKCSNLYEGVDSLQQSRLLRRMNPDLVDYTISEAIEARYKYIEPKINSGLKNKVQKLASTVESILKAKA